MLRRRKLQNKNLEKLKFHVLASEELSAILALPATRSEKKIVASLARAYEKMGECFPSLELRSDLEALYSNTLSLLNGLSFAMREILLRRYTLDGALGTKELSLLNMTPKAQEKTIRAWVEATHRVDISPVFQRTRKLRFLALQTAAERIEAALE
jgi:hypothetical protein